MNNSIISDYPIEGYFDQPWDVYNNILMVDPASSNPNEVYSLSHNDGVTVLPNSGNNVLFSPTSLMYADDPYDNTYYTISELNALGMDTGSFIITNPNFVDKSIAGHTGDTIGASQQISEITLLICLALWI